MKKLFLVLAAVLLVGVMPAMADTKTYFNKGDMVAQVGLGYGWGIAVEGGVDVGLGQWTPIPILPLDYGWAVRAGVTTSLWGIGGGVGGFGTVHYSWKNLKTGIEFVDHLETAQGIGVQVFFLGSYGLYPGLGSYSDFTYHFDDKMAIDLGYTTFSGSTIGITYKL